MAALASAWSPSRWWCEPVLVTWATFRGFAGLPLVAGLRYTLGSPQIPLPTLP